MAKLRAAVIRLSSIVSTFEKKLSVARFPLPPVFYHTMLFWVTISGTSSPRSRNFRLNIFVKTIVKCCTKNSHRYWAHASVPQAILRLIVKDVVRTGVKVIWTEKPIALSIAEIDSMNQVCNENRITLNFLFSMLNLFVLHQTNLPQPLPTHIKTAMTYHCSRSGHKHWNMTTSYMNKRE